MIDNSLNTLVAIPAYNAESTLPTLLPQVREYVCDDNLLLINDGSTDQTLDFIKDTGLNFISFPQNRGKGEALRAAYQFAADRHYRSILSLDSDRQHDPSLIPAFFSRDTGRQLVLGRRLFEQSDMPLHRRLSNYLTSLIISVFSRSVRHDSQCGYRLVPVDLIRKIRLTARSFDLESQLLFQAGLIDYPVVELPVPTSYNAPSSSINPTADTARFVRQLWRGLWY